MWQQLRSSSTAARRRLTHIAASSEFLQMTTCRIQHHISNANYIHKVSIPVYKIGYQHTVVTAFIYGDEFKEELSITSVVASIGAPYLSNNSITLMWFFLHAI